MNMTQEERDDLLLATYIQIARIYDLLLVGEDADREAIAKLHSEGKLIGPPPTLDGESDDTPVENT